MIRKLTINPFIHKREWQIASLAVSKKYVCDWVIIFC